MANELTISASLKFVSGNYKVDESIGGLQIDVTGNQFIRHVQEIGISADEAIDLVDISAGGYMFLKNLDSTNYIQIQPANDETALIRLKAGEVALFRLDAGATAPYAIANTAACDLLVVLIEA